MAESKFVVKKITNLSEMKEGDIIPVSDFSLLAENDKFVQFTFDEIESDNTIKISPGIYAVTKVSHQVTIKPTAFIKESILDDYGIAQSVSSKIDSFFNALPKYKKMGVFPKRGILLYGPPGVGKTQVISSVCTKYALEQNAAVILWSTSEFDASEVKSLIRRLTYENVEKFFLIAEDIGGAEYVGGQMAVKASLLSLLDAMEETFQKPTMILATTNYPENLLEMLTNRPQRFDDKIEVPSPSPEARSKFLAFFMERAENPSLEGIEEIKQKKYDGLSVAHVKEVVVRSEIYGISIIESLEQINKESQKAKKHFIKENRTGFGFGAEE